MAVLVLADVPGQTPAGYDGMLVGLEPLIRQAKGFIAHGGGPSGDSWQIVELWETAADATDFFAKYVQPALPPGLKPKRTYVELHRLVMP